MAYCHVPKEKRKKLNQTEEKGYSETVRAYRIYIPSSRKVVVRRDVKFMEDKAFRKSPEMPSKKKSKDDPLV